jgi:DNA invertase Pin-like site-specific DNA recombinase
MPLGKPKGAENMREISKITPNKICRKKRVAAYARVSINSEKLMHSLSSQISYYSEFIQKNPEWTYVGVYADEGITGTLAEKRDEFKRLIADCNAGKIDIILVKSISRFARNTVDLLETVRHLKSLGIEVRFEKENINSLSKDGELMLSILASFAQEESRSISENVKWGTRKRFEQGIPNGRVRLFGYKWQENTLVIVPEEAEVVKRIYREYLNGNSPRKIAKALNTEGITTRLGCLWSDTTIRGVLTNITYTGNMLLQKTFVDNPITKKRKKNRGELTRYFAENTHEPIIDMKTFENVKMELIKRGKKSIYAKGETQWKAE